MLTQGVAVRTPLRGVVPAVYPALLGTLVYDGSVEMPVAGQPGYCVLHHRITRSSMSGLLHFAYRLEIAGGEWAVPIALGVVFADHSAQLTFADFRIDSAGAMPPNSAEVAANGDFTFRFDHGLGSERGGMECFVMTNAREFRESGGRLTVSAGGKSVSLNVPTPIGMPLRPVTVRAAEAPPDPAPDR